MIELKDFIFPSYLESTSKILKGKVINRPGIATFKKNLRQGYIITNDKIMKIQRSKNKIEKYKITQYKYKDIHLNIKNIINYKYSKPKDIIYNTIANKNIIFKILVVNDYNRTNRLKENIQNDTIKILKNIRNYLPINIEIIDILYLKEKIESTNPDNILKFFYNKMNNFIQENEINSHLNILLLERQVTACNNIIQGTTYFKGACSVNQGFSVIFLDAKNSYNENGRIIAHEILHSLGATHENTQNSIMNYLSDEKNINITENTLNEIQEKLNTSGCFTDD